MKKWLHFRKPKSVKEYCILIAGIIAVLGLMIFIAVKCAFNSMVIKTDYEEFVPSEKNHQDLAKIIEKDGPVQDQTVMIFGVDKGESRTDTILVAHFDSKEDRTVIISIPRDTKVEWTDEQIRKAEELNLYYQSPCKITEMSAYGGIDNLRYFTIRSVEEMLDVKVDHYAVVNTQVIREIVDKLGGIEIEVPRVMKYDDSVQDLHIDLLPGMQKLNGEQAEGLLRWRHNKDYSEQYAQGDLGRIETQQLFIKTFIKKITTDVTLDKLIDVITAVYSNVKTDVGFEEAIKYLEYVSHISTEKMSMKTLIGRGAYQNGKSYYLPDTVNMMKFVDKEFYSIESGPYEEWSIPEDEQDNTITPDMTYGNDIDIPDQVEITPDYEANADNNEENAENEENKSNKEESPSNVDSAAENKVNENSEDTPNGNDGQVSIQHPADPIETENQEKPQPENTAPPSNNEEAEQNVPEPEHSNAHSDPMQSSQIEPQTEAGSSQDSFAIKQQ